LTGIYSAFEKLFGLRNDSSDLDSDFRRNDGMGEILGLKVYPPLFLADLPASGWDKRKIYLPPIFGGIPKFARRMWVHKFIVLYSRFLKST